MRSDDESQTQPLLPQPNEDEADKNDETLLSWLLRYVSGHSFLLMIIFSVALAAIIPQVGQSHGPLYPRITASWVAVVLIFVISGLTMKTTEFTRICSVWSLHLSIQAFVFGIMPLMGLIILLIGLSASTTSPAILDGFLICLCMPSTISSGVLLSINSGGSEAVAVLNAALSNSLAIFLTPALLLMFFGRSGMVSLRQVILKLVLKVFLPFIVGQVIRFTVGASFITKHKVKLRYAMRFSLCFIIFTVMSTSFYSRVTASVSDVAVVVFLSLLVHGSAMLLFWWVSGFKCLSEFTIPERITGTIMASHKSAAMGVPLIHTMYEHNPHLGIFTLPLLVYHPLQLLVDSFLAPMFLGMSQTEDEENEKGSDDNAGDDDDDDGKARVEP